MNHLLSTENIESYRKNGFIIIDDFLTSDELMYWNKSIENALEERNGRKFPYTELKSGEDDGINKDAKYFGKVFDQIINLWQTNDDVKRLITDPRIGQMAADLMQVDAVRIWHDQSLVKQPWANPTAWHVDTPFWSFSDREALSIWVALEDVTIENGCMYFMAGSHLHTRLEEPGISTNIGDIFDKYPEYRLQKPVKAVLKAGSCTFHNGLTLHAAGANMTVGTRRAMTCVYMPATVTFNGTKNILTDAQVAALKIGDPLNDENQNPIIFSRSMSKAS
ncbi:MAG: phytanoyl-CoA dioxygenase family protein [Saprospiraceae bacterium]